MSVSALEDLLQQASERIWLVPVTADEGGLTFNWCDDPAPAPGMDPAEAVEYVRADVHRKALREAEAERDALATQFAERDNAAANLQATLAEWNRLHSDATNGDVVYVDGTIMGRLVDHDWLERADELATHPYGTSLARLKAYWEAEQLEDMAKCEADWTQEELLEEADRLRRGAEGGRA